MQDNIAYLTKYVEGLEDFLRADNISDRWAKTRVQSTNLSRTLRFDEKQAINIEIAQIKERIIEIRLSNRMEAVFQYGKDLIIKPAIVK